jgi:hypothetical protein
MGFHGSSREAYDTFNTALATGKDRQGRAIVGYLLLLSGAC